MSQKQKKKNDKNVKNNKECLFINKNGICEISEEKCHFKNKSECKETL